MSSLRLDLTGPPAAGAQGQRARGRSRSKQNPRVGPAASRIDSRTTESVALLETLTAALFEKLTAALSGALRRYPHTMLRSPQEGGFIFDRKL